MTSHLISEDADIEKPRAIYAHRTYYALTSIFRIHGTYTVRVGIMRSPNLAHSELAIDVLVSATQWDRLAVVPPINWHGDTPDLDLDTVSAGEIAATLRDLTTQIADRVTAMLAPAAFGERLPTRIRLDAVYGISDYESLFYKPVPQDGDLSWLTSRSRKNRTKKPATAQELEAVANYYGTHDTSGEMADGTWVQPDPDAPSTTDRAHTGPEEKEDNTTS